MIFCTRLKSWNRRSSDKSSVGRSFEKSDDRRNKPIKGRRESSILPRQQEIISHDRIRLLMGWIPRTERRDFQSTFTLVFEPFCYASRGPLMRSHTIHVAIVQDHCFGRTSAFRSFNERRARMSDSSRIPSLLFLARERRKRRYLSPFRRFRSLDPSHSFSATRSTLSRSHRWKNFTKDKRDIRIQCLVRNGHTNHINDIELQMRLRLRKSFYRISIVYPLTGLCLHSFEIKRHSQSACTHVQAARHAFREIWQSIIESVAKLCPDFRILIRGWTIFERIVHRAFIVSFVYDKFTL